MGGWNRQMVTRTFRPVNAPLRSVLKIRDATEHTSKKATNFSETTGLWNKTTKIAFERRQPPSCPSDFTIDEISMQKSSLSNDSCEVFPWLVVTRQGEALCELIVQRRETECVYAHA